VDNPKGRRRDGEDILATRRSASSVRKLELSPSVRFSLGSVKKSRKDGSRLAWKGDAGLTIVSNDTAECRAGWEFHARRRTLRVV
jgi:hypothetical protein